MAESVSCDLDAAQVTPEVKTELDPEEESHEWVNFLSEISNNFKEILNYL